MDKDILIGISKSPETEHNAPKFVLAEPFNCFKESILSPREVSASFPVEVTSAFIDLLKDAGMAEELTTKNADGTYTHEILPIDDEWPRVIES